MEVYHDIQTLFFGSSGFVHNVLFTVPSVFGIYPYAQADGIYAQLFHQLEAVGFYAFMIVKLQPFFSISLTQLMSAPWVKLVLEGAGVSELSVPDCSLPWLPQADEDNTSKAVSI